MRAMDPITQAAMLLRQTPEPEDARGMLMATAAVEQLLAELVPVCRMLAARATQVDTDGLVATRVLAGAGGLPELLREAGRLVDRAVRPVGEAGQCVHAAVRCLGVIVPQ